MEPQVNIDENENKNNENQEEYVENTNESNEANSTSTNAPNKCVFVSGIPYNTTEDEVREKFSSCGVIKELKMPKYQDSGRNIGYAHIYFKKNNSVKKVRYLFNFLALEFNKSYIGQRYITVSIAQGENKQKRMFF